MPNRDQRRACTQYSTAPSFDISFWKEENALKWKHYIIWIGAFAVYVVLRFKIVWNIWNYLKLCCMCCMSKKIEESRNVRMYFNTTKYIIFSYFFRYRSRRTCSHRHVSRVSRLLRACTPLCGVGRVIKFDLVLDEHVCRTRQSSQ